MERQSSGSPSLETKFTEMLKNVKPPEIYGPNMQCIYRVPQRLRENNPKAYTPQIVSIGPFHKARDVGKEENILESMEELKLKYLKGFLNRKQLPMGNFVVKLENLEERIRSCYAETIKYNKDDFIMMILIDACFIIEHFLRWHKCEEWAENDPLFRKPWMQTGIYHDLILLENQLPFFVLEELYNLCGMNQEFGPFLEITFNYFKVKSKTGSQESPKHFTDLLRTFIVSSSKIHHTRSIRFKLIKHIYSTSQLRERGLKFKVSPNDSIIDLHYDKGVLRMPVLYIDNDTEIRFRNIEAFEHCHLPHTSIFTQYLAILDFLINTEKDVNILVDKKIIVHRMGDANAVATMVNSLGSNVMMSLFDSNFISLCNSLTDFYEEPHNKYMAIFMHEYFNTPWKIASTIAAIVLLLLTLIQTICSIISLFKGC